MGKLNATARCREFVVSLKDLYDSDVKKKWIPFFAKRARTAIQGAPEGDKAYFLAKFLYATWHDIVTVRFLLLRDLSLFVQENPSQFNGNEKKWLADSADEICLQVFNKQRCFEWIAYACDGTEGLGTLGLREWHAPSWLSELGGQKTNLSNQRSESENRLSKTHTTQLLNRVYNSLEIRKDFDSKEVNRLYVFLCQRTQLTPGYPNLDISRKIVPPIGPGLAEEVSSQNSHVKRNRKQSRNDGQKDDSIVPQQQNEVIKASVYRARLVAKIFKELSTLKPQMYGPASYEDCIKRYPTYTVFKIATKRPDLQEKIESIQGSRRHMRLAQELAGQQFNRELTTIQTDWKRNKPKQFRQK